LAVHVRRAVRRRSGSRGSRGWRACRSTRRRGPYRGVSAMLKPLHPLEGGHGAASCTTLDWRPSPMLDGVEAARRRRGARPEAIGPQAPSGSPPV
jgi:hypothetical protein